MTTGKHIDGVSKNQVRRVKNLHEKFKFDGNYFSILKNNEWKLVPKKEERKELILKAHLLGHFENATSMESIKQKYYWKNMFRDAEYFIQRCYTCQRNKGMAPIEHKAKALIVNNLFQRIGMDIVGGLPETEEGYHMILVIVEYMSKMVKIYPLKTKTAEEVAERLWQWIATYGPPEELLTDCGIEFVNKVITNLINKIGIERRITSAYNPRTDGLWERANHQRVKKTRRRGRNELA